MMTMARLSPSARVLSLVKGWRSQSFSTRRPRQTTIRSVAGVYHSTFTPLISRGQVTALRHGWTMRHIRASLCGACHSQASRRRTAIAGLMSQSPKGWCTKNSNPKRRLLSRSLQSHLASRQTAQNWTCMKKCMTRTFKLRYP